MSLVRAIRKSSTDVVLYENPTTVTVVEPERWRSADWSPDWYFGSNGVDYHFVYTGCTSSLNAYQNCSPLAAIINKQAQAHINGKTWILNSSGKAKGKESTGDFARRLRALMARPNPLQTWREFEAQQKIYMKVFGFCILLPIIPVGFEKLGASYATSLWLIPPYLLDIEETNKLFYQTDLKGIVSKIVLKYKGTRSELDLNDIYIFKDFVPSMGDSLVFPESRIQGLRMNINNIIGIYESLNQSINYAGAQGIFTPATDANGPIPLKLEDKLEIQKDFRRYGLKKDQWKYIFSPTTIKWEQVGRPIAEQMYLEQVEDNIMRICDAYNHPFRLVASINNNSLGGTDKKVETRNLYADAVIPDSDSMYDMWNAVFKAEENGVIIQKDFSHIDALQEDKLLNAQAQRQQNESCKIMFFNNLITYNRWLEIIGEDTVSEAFEIGGKQVQDAGNMYYYQLKALGMEFGGMGVTSNTNQDGNQAGENNNNGK